MAGSEAHLTPAHSELLLARRPATFTYNGPVHCENITSGNACSGIIKTCGLKLQEATHQWIAVRGIDLVRCRSIGERRG